MGDVPALTRRGARQGFLPSGDDADLAAFDVAVITVPTPLRDGVPDMSFIEDAHA